MRRQLTIKVHKCHFFSLYKKLCERRRRAYACTINKHVCCARVIVSKQCNDSNTFAFLKIECFLLTKCKIISMRRRLMALSR